MPLHISTTVRSRAIVAPACMLAAGNCRAMGGEGVAESIIILGGSYIVGVLVLSIVWWITKKAVCGWVLLVFFAAPFVLFALAQPYAEYSRARHVAEVASDRAQNLQAFAGFCQERKRVVTWQVAQAQSASLLVRIDDRFSRHDSDFSAAALQAYMAKHPASCEKTSLGRLEGVFRGDYTPGEGYAREVRTFQMCGPDEPRISAQTGSRFELVIGEQVETRNTPVTGWSDTMSRASVRLMDAKTGQTLAQDTIHVLWHGDGTRVCPDGAQQIATLIADVFPK